MATKARPGRLRIILRWAVLVLALAIVAVATAARPILDGRPLSDSLDFLLVPLAWAVAGAIVMAKRPWHPVGWALIWVAAGLAVTVIEWTTLSRIPPSWGPWMAWALTCGGIFTYSALVVLLVVFPDGTADRTARERRFGAGLVSVMVTLLLLAAVSDPVGSTESVEYPNPLGLAWVPRAAIDLSYLGVFAVIAVSVVWMWVRRRRESGEVQRRYTLVLYSFALLIASLILGISLGEVAEVAWWPALILWHWVPVAFAIAVVRHGLYGVDRLVSRTVTYAVVGAALSVLFAVPVVLAPSLLGVSDDLAVAGATLASAAAFNPLRRRVRRAADRKFYRTRFDAESEMGEFSNYLRAVRGIDDIDAELQRTVARTIHPASISVWIPGRPARGLSPTGQVR